jgi:5-methylcytosine-specific restriction protein A
MKRLPSINHHLVKKKSFIVQRNDDDVKVYNSRKWRKVAKNHLKENPLCVECLKLGRSREAKVCDHVKPIRLGGSIWGKENHQGLCIKHHNRKSGGEARIK